jgi:hypothetical protein
MCIKIYVVLPEAWVKLYFLILVFGGYYTLHIDVGLSGKGYVPGSTPKPGCGAEKIDALEGFYGWGLNDFG